MSDPASLPPPAPSTSPASPEPAAPPAAAAAAPVVSDTARAFEAKARVELVRLSFNELKSSTFASAATAIALAFVVGSSPHSEPTVVGAWFAAMTLASIYRLQLAVGFYRSDAQAQKNPQWGLKLIAGTTATGLIWGCSAWLFPTFDSGNNIGIIHALILAGIATGSTRLLQPMRKGSVLYLVAVMAPLALRFAAQGDVTGLTFAGCVVVFVVYLISATLRNHRTLSDATVQRFEREAIAAELHAEARRRESREAELLEARQRAETANKAKGEFLATISHEIRTPMNGVLGMLRIVRDTPLSPEQRGYLKTASDSAEALLLLLNDVLDFSKIEAGRLELEQAPFPPAPMARAVCDLLHTRARDKGLTFDLQLADNLPGAIVGDSTRIRQILVNLLGNAIKFTDKGRVELRVACLDRNKDGAVMHFTVTDTGIGIDSGALERLFKPFTQADNSMSRRYGGTGLGLAISLRLAQAMGGSLQVQSTLNQGSTFRFILPCKLPEATVAAARTEEAPRFVTPKLSGRVLVVEDDLVNQQVIELFLKKLQVTIKFAGDGETAITATTTEKFDLVLMDCQLPGIDGLETTRRIRTALAGTPLTIIALTANASTHVREACLAAGMDDFLTKPVRFELLAGVLQRNLPAATPAP